MVADVGITVCIAVENDGYPVAAAQFQHGDIVFLCVQAVALRMQGTGIDFEKYMVLLCGADQGLVIDRETSVIRVADDLNSRIFHGAQVGSRVLVNGAAGIAGIVDAGNGKVQPVHIAGF